MKQILLTFMISLLAVKAFASGVLIQAAGSSQTEFDSFLKEHPENVSFSQYLVQRLQTNPRQEEELYRIGENLEASPKNISDSLRLIQKSGPLSLNSVNFLYDLSSKLMERSDLKNNFDIKTVNCKVRGLLGMHLEKCSKVRVDFIAINRQWPTAQTLVIESTAYPISTANSLEVSIEAVYEFQLLSDTHQAVNFRGTYNQLMQQHFVFVPMVEGNCKGYATSIDDFNIQSSGTLFFSKDCLKPANAPPAGNRFSEWLSENKAWIYPVGIILIGSAAAYGLKDKKIVVEKP
ncbi:hypothetical protein DOM22_17225 [Bdellovibrio sp. ZAP7]|uniref:hypothetical protein n=1 Tax=Bdellovibrio sp. ZAP7 TaxID=2231053 RepID=UPI001159340E|nr:hypothetical protein [Bdellovibrio sp. ZAP7]QDK46773.1 hypothetical protein DOM22_17225 [Bdellovibrio sp. ZAP7]